MEVRLEKRAEATSWTAWIGGLGPGVQSMGGCRIWEGTWQGGDRSELGLGERRVWAEPGGCRAAGELSRESRREVKRAGSGAEAV